MTPRAKEMYNEIGETFSQKKLGFNGFNEDADILIQWLCGKLATLEERIRFLEREMPRTVR